MQLKVRSIRVGQVLLMLQRSLEDWGYDREEGQDFLRWESDWGEEGWPARGAAASERDGAASRPRAGPASLRRCPFPQRPVGPPDVLISPLALTIPTLFF